MATINEAKERLDKLINKGRHRLYKPIQIAEILYKARTSSDVVPSKRETYRRISNTWKADIALRLFGRRPSLNSRYEDQLFDDAVIPPQILNLLATANQDGVVEAYIYHMVYGTQILLGDIRAGLDVSKPSAFDLESFLKMFEGESALRRSADKAYEILVYALFDTLANHLGATVTLSVSQDKREIVKDFEKFTTIVLGIDPDLLSISQPARLFRLGVTNAADARIDMWANFGPAVQVKHITLDPEEGKRIVDEVMADKIIIVCKHAEQKVIESIISQVGLKNKIRGFITEKDLVSWYKLCMAKYANSIGIDVLRALSHEFDVEFPLAKSAEIEKFLKERGYSRKMLQGIWALPD
jgi:type II restriction enzyme